MAAFAVAFAAVAQAATISWDNGFGINAYNQPGDLGDAYVGTIYLMVGGTSDATAFMAAVLAADADYATKFNELVGDSIASMEHTDFEPNPYSFTTTLTGKYDFFVVALDVSNNGVYMSEIADANIYAVGEAEVRFSHDAAYENAAFQPGAQVSDAGWYTAAPEPTSGLLLLLGMAGLALKRKIA